jgi:NADH:ubiquinone oxidoreductase subunit 4 (subunit M)
MIRLLSKWILSLLLIIFICSFLFFNKLFFGIQFFLALYKYEWINIKYYFFFDNISIFFVILSLFLLIICLLISWYWNYFSYLYYSLILLSMFCLFNIFLTMDIFILFFFFELIIIPLFLLIGIWGSRIRKIYAAYMLFLYTLFGSIFSLFAIFFLYFNKGSSNYIFFFETIFNSNFQTIIFLFLFFGFAVKVPIIPLHIWLPEAHVEAPTSGSVILAGIVLKLGFYIYMRILVFLFSDIIYSFLNLVFIIAILSFYLASFSALAQIDIKKIIAYSSIAHMILL